MSNKNLNVPDTKKIVEALIHIENESKSKGSKRAKYISNRCNTIARTIHENLDIIVEKKTGKIISEPEISFRYYTKIMERLRSAVKEIGYKHHSIEKHLHAFVEKYSDKIEGLDKLLDPNLPIEKLRDNFILLRSKATSGSQYKKDLLKIRFEHHLFYCLETKGAIKDWKKEDDTKSLEKKLNNVITVNPEWIKKIVTSIFNDKNASITNIAIAIALSTGRRLTEIMKTAKFKRLSENKVMFSGQLKTKNRSIFEVIDAYEIPTLVDSNLVIKALRKLRRNTGNDVLKYKNVKGLSVESTVKGGDIKDYDHNAAVSNKYVSTLNRGAQALLETPELNISSCRALYTEITYDEHAKPGETRSAYRKRVCGHSLIETQLHYDVYKISSEIEKIEVMIDGESDGNKKSNENLFNYISMADEHVRMNTRAKAMQRVHEWLKEEVAGGLSYKEISPNFIRSTCLIDGKQINLNTIKLYLSDYIKIQDYKEPVKKTKPKNKNEALLLQLEEQLQQYSSRKEELDEQINDEMFEIDRMEEELELKREDKEELERELDNVNENIEEIMANINQLKKEKK